jgi:uncharacterized BrkB/YihY/UPF0761 family membrane protein
MRPKRGYPHAVTEEPGGDPAPEGRIAGARAKAEQLQHRAEQLQHRAEERLHQESARRSWVRMLLDAYEADRNRGGGLLAGGLAYRIFLWELPAALFVVSLFGLASTSTGVSPEDAADRAGLGGAVAAMVAGAVSQTEKARWWLFVIGAVLMVWAGRSAVRAFQLVPEIAWRRREPFRPSSIKGSLAFSAVALGAIAIQAVSARLFSQAFVVHVVAWVLASVLFAIVAIWIMSFLPHGGRPWTVVVPGALGFTLGIRLLSLATAIYFVPKLGRIDDLYGAMGIAVVILLWLYVIARLFVGRAVPQRHGRRGVARADRGCRRPGRTRRRDRRDRGPVAGSGTVPAATSELRCC